MSIVTLEHPTTAPAGAPVCSSRFELRCEDWLPRPIEEVFPFFADAYNLEHITPPFLRFRVTGTSDRNVRKGTLIDYRLRLHGIPFGWQTIIDEWEPGVRFVDRQIRGPFALWHHTHEFETRDRGTIIRDRVRYDLPLGALGRLAAGWLVRRDVEEIFRYRREKTREIFGID
jgi:ligand-binding SRPBCC domain-containing protein